MIGNIWTSILENLELSSNIVVLIFIIIGFIINFTMMREDVSDVSKDIKSISKRLNKISKQVNQIQSTNLVSENKVNNIKKNITETKNKVKTVKKNTSELKNKYSKFSVKLKNIRYNQKKIEREVDKYHD